MSHIQTIKTGIRFIENHIDKNINIHEVAKSTYYSPYHFSRIFLKYTGITLGSYINNRKMGFSYFQLLHSSKSLLDISSAAGYTSYEAFSREIKSKFGMSPYYLRKEKTFTYLRNHSFLDDKLLDHIMKILSIPSVKSFLKSFDVYGYSVTTSLFDNQLPFLWEQFHHAKNLLLKTDGGSESFSICESKDAILDGDGDSIFSQFLAFKNTQVYLKTPSNFVVREIKSGNYVIFKHRDTYHSLNLTYRYIWNIWIHSSTFLYDHTRNSFEYYSTDRSEISIYIPVI